MTDKYLSEVELAEFIEWCKQSKITQKKIAEICGVHEQWISKVFTSRKIKRNKNFKGDPEKIIKPKFERAKAKLVLLIKKDQILKEFPKFLIL